MNAAFLLVATAWVPGQGDGKAAPACTPVCAQTCCRESFLDRLRCRLDSCKRDRSCDPCAHNRCGAAKTACPAPAAAKTTCPAPHCAKAACGDDCGRRLLDFLRCGNRCDDGCKHGKCGKSACGSKACDPCAAKCRRRDRCHDNCGTRCHDNCGRGRKNCDPCAKSCHDDCGGLLSRLRGLFNRRCCDTVVCCTSPAPAGKKTSIGSEPPSGSEIRILTPPTRGAIPQVNTLEVAPTLVPGINGSRNPF